MNREILPQDRLEPEALNQMANYHSDIVKEVQTAISTNKVVIVGMRQNPVVKSAKKALTSAGIPFTYLEYGSYFSMWKQRLAIKLWSGWPTYPQVFFNGKLVGGRDETVKALAAGKFKS